MKTEILIRPLIGIIIFLTQLPESVAFAFLAKLTPPLGLHSAWIIGLISAVFGGRPGMISGAAGARATIIGAFLGTPARPGLNGEGAEIVFLSVIISGRLPDAHHLRLRPLPLHQDHSGVGDGRLPERDRHPDRGLADLLLPGA
jgi:hypothetical protein